MFRLSTAVLLFGSAIAMADAPYWVFFGTGAKSSSKGIMRSEFDPATGKLSDPVLAAEVTNPTFIAISPSGKNLYAIGEVNQVGGKKAGGVHAFTLDTKTGTLTKLNDSDSGGPGPCHVICDPKGECLLIANYGGGSVKCLKLLADGSIGTQSTFIQHAGSSVNPARQKEPHAHSTNVSPDSRFAIVADLGTDKLNVYKLNGATAVIEANTPPAFTTHRGAGPRHFAWHPNGQYAYTNGELDATVTAMKWDPKRGSFESINVASTLPPDTSAEVKAKNSTAEIVVHPSGKHVFVSNRGHNSIATFKVKPDGGLEPLGHLVGDIKTPRNFNLDPTGQWLLIANMDGESVRTFAWDDATGTGKETANVVTIGKPMCIKFIKKQ